MNLQFGILHHFLVKFGEELLFACDASILSMCEILWENLQKARDESLLGLKHFILNYMIECEKYCFLTWKKSIVQCISHSKSSTFYYLQCSPTNVSCNTASRSRFQFSELWYGWGGGRNGGGGKGLQGRAVTHYNLGGHVSGVLKTEKSLSHVMRFTILKRSESEQLTLKTIKY